MKAYNSMLFLYVYLISEFREWEREELPTHFQSILTSSEFTVELIPDQWILLKARLYETGESLHLKTWLEINRSFQLHLPNILSLVDLILTVPASTADCEIGFNHMKLVKVIGGPILHQEACLCFRYELVYLPRLEWEEWVEEC